MDIMELGAIGEIIGGVAVIGSLIYVGLQVRRNTATVRAGSAQAFADSINGVSLIVAGGVEPARIWRLAMEDPGALTPDEKMCADYMCLTGLHPYDSAFLQAELGSLDTETFDMLCKRLRGSFANAYWHEWARNPYVFSDRLVRFIENECGVSNKAGREA